MGEVTATINIGIWVVPLVITVGSMWWALSKSGTGSGSSYGPDFTGLFEFVGAVIISLVAWLIWAIIV